MSTNLVSTLISAAAIAGAVAVFVVPTLTDQTDGEAPPAEPRVNAVSPGAEPEISSRRQAVLSIRGDGHYWARTVINGRSSVDFMVDTGASTVALTLEDARKAGLDLDALDFSSKINTAGGMTVGADVVLDEIKVGNVVVRNVPAVVMGEDLTQSLLGMSFLRELYSIEFRGERIIIRQ